VGGRFELDREFGPADGGKPGQVAGSFGEADRSVHPVTIGERHPGKAQRVCACDQLLRM